MQTGKSSLKESPINKNGKDQFILVRPAHWGDFEICEEDIRKLLVLYFESSKDKTATPEEGYDLLKEKVRNDKNYLLVFAFKDNIPFAFLSSDFLGDTCRILMAYIPPDLSSRENKIVVDQGLGFFDKWSRIKGAKRQLFYAIRNPGAYKLMTSRGWKHSITTYEKEIVYG